MEEVKEFYHLLKKVTADPGSRAGELINWLNERILWVGGALLGILLLVAFYEQISIIYLRFRAWRAGRSTRASNLSDVEIDALCRKLTPLPLRLSFAADRVKRIVGLRMTAANASEQLGQIDADAVETRMTVPRFLSRIPILLGLTGTLMGLTVAIEEIRPLIEEIENFKDLPSLLASMVQTLSGMKTAFSTSVLGLVTSLVLTAAATIVGAFYAATLVQLDRLTNQHLIPLFAVHDWKAVTEGFSNALDNSSSVLSQTAVSMNQWTERLTDAIEKTKEAEDNLSGSITVFTKGMIPIRDGLVGEVKQFRTALQELTRATLEVKDNLGRLQTKEDGGLDRKEFSEILSNISATLETVISDVGRIAQGSPEIYAETLSSVRDNTKADLVNLLDHIKAGFDGGIESFRKDNQQVVDALIENKEGFASSTSKYTDATMKAIGRMEAISTVLEKLPPGGAAPYMPPIHHPDPLMDDGIHAGNGSGRRGVLRWFRGGER